MHDIDEFLQVIGTETRPEHRKCRQIGCNKNVATMEEATEQEHITKTCWHCFKIYLPKDGDRSPNLVRTTKETVINKAGAKVEYKVEYYEDGFERSYERYRIA